MPTGALSLTCLFLLDACAHTGTSIGREPIALPTAVEIEGVVREKWSYWGPRFAFFAQRKGEPATLVSVENVQCGYDYVVAACRMDVTGVFADGQRSTQRMFSQFDREDGKLVDVIVDFHVLIRCPRG